MEINQKVKDKSGNIYIYLGRTSNGYYAFRDNNQMIWVYMVDEVLELFNIKIEE